MDQGSGFVIASVIAAGPAGIAAVAALRTNRKIKTNHGKTIGQHVEDLSQWAEFHQESDNELRRVLGLPDATFPLFPPRVPSDHDYLTEAP